MSVGSSFGSAGKLKTRSGEFTYYSLQALSKAGVGISSDFRIRSEFSWKPVCGMSTIRRQRSRRREPGQVECRRAIGR